ncbi:hypothetical protein AB0C76_34645 [Kitasatospora sp. NPDC048722]|uniref:hypothetical protein n=1 Tax=Kitasatospora sp. NPDC048722 TaxID=3155639 RepID=UPI003406DA1E
MSEARRSAPLEADLTKLLSGVGLPVSSTGDRRTAEGVVVTANGGSATVEWFAPLKTRKAAAAEHSEGLVNGKAVMLHQTARDYVHQMIYAFLSAWGYEIEQDSTGALRVSRSAKVISLGAQDDGDGTAGVLVSV